jgi:hypothetical protein
MENGSSFRMNRYNVFRLTAAKLTASLITAKLTSKNHFNLSPFVPLSLNKERGKEGVRL